MIQGEDATVMSLTDMVSETIVKEIVCGERTVGSRLKSTQVAERLGVSRTPVAKAFARLAADGILLQPNNHQAIVADGAAEWLVQLHEIRELLEPEAAFRAAGNIAPDVLDDLQALAKDAKPTKGEEWGEAAGYFDFGLHLAIAEFCGNLPMKTSIRKCWSYKRVSYDLADGCRAELKPEYEQHVQILHAVAAGDAKRARRLMREHLERASERRPTSRVI